MALFHLFVCHVATGTAPKGGYPAR
jgi:hypothetical protein